MDNISMEAEDFLSSVVPSRQNPDIATEDFLGETTEAVRESYFEPGYEGKIDPRIRQISYSALSTLHECPRKFQLDRLRYHNKKDHDYLTKVTFAFGHAFGEGVQLALQGKDFEEIVFTLFLKWEPDLFAQDEKAKKSFFFALQAVEKFMSIREQLLEGWELMYYKGKPSCELSARIHLPHGFKYRLFIDAVLINPATKQIKVLETKTTGMKVIHPALYKNSAQGVGYSVVIDKLAGEFSDYEVLYLPYQTTSGEFIPFPFPKTRLQRALWLRELLLEVDRIRMYEDAEIYPMHGESCNGKYGKPCQYFETCQLSTSYQTSPCKEEDVDDKEYDIEVSFEELIEAQFKLME